MLVMPPSQICSMVAKASEEKPSINNVLDNGVLHHVFDHLGARDMAHVSCVCKLWHALTRDAQCNRTWAVFYSQRWQAPAITPPEWRWQAAYGSKLRALNTYSSHCQTDSLHGHSDSVRACALLPAHNLLVTGSDDHTVRIWDLEGGLPLACTRALGGTVRCVAADEHLLVAATSHDFAIRAWRPSEAAETGNAHFRLASNTRLRGGHGGPVTALELTECALYSGSWDYTVRVWGRGPELRCAAVIPFPDWVWGLAARGPHLLVAAGQTAHVHDIGSGALVRRYLTGDSGHALASLCVEGTRDGRLLIAGGSNGQLLCYDLRRQGTAPVATLWQQSQAITSLSFEDPWLACGSSSGVVSLLNVEACMRKPAPKSTTERGKVAPTHQRRQLQGPGGAVNALDMSAGWLVVGGQASTARSWKFTENMKAGRESGAQREVKVEPRWCSDKGIPTNMWVNKSASVSGSPVRLPVFSALRRAQQSGGGRGGYAAGGGRGVRSMDAAGSAGRHQQGRAEVPFVPLPSVSPLSCRRQAASEQQTSWQIVRPRPALSNTARG